MKEHGQQPMQLVLPSLPFGQWPLSRKPRRPRRVDLLSSWPKASQITSHLSAIYRAVSSSSLRNIHEGKANSSLLRSSIGITSKPKSRARDPLGPSNRRASSIHWSPDLDSTHSASALNNKQIELPASPNLTFDDGSNLERSFPASSNGQNRTPCGRPDSFRKMS
jgi:hypothetical protein